MEDFTEEKECLICKKTGAGGLMVDGERICPGCEEKILKAGVNSPEYLKLMESMREFWQKRLSNHKNLDLKEST